MELNATINTAVMSAIVWQVRRYYEVYEVTFSKW